MKLTLKRLAGICSFVLVMAFTWRTLPTMFSQADFAPRVVAQPGSPVEVSLKCHPKDSLRSGTSDAFCEVKGRNTDARPITAFGFVIEGQTADASIVRLNAISSDAAFPLPRLRGSIGPEEEFETDFRYPAKAEGAQLRLQFVEFLDGSVWGEETALEFRVLRARRDGARKLLGQIRDLKASGVSADRIVAEVNLMFGAVSQGDVFKTELETAERTGAEMIANLIRAKSRAGGASLALAEVGAN